MNSKELKRKYRETLRHGINQRNRARLTNTTPSIIANNCNAGVICHDLGLRFLSPTVNLYIPFPDYVRFCQRLDHYLGLPAGAMTRGGRHCRKTARPASWRTYEWCSSTIPPSRRRATNGSKERSALI